MPNDPRALQRLSTQATFSQHRCFFRVQRWVESALGWRMVCDGCREWEFLPYESVVGSTIPVRKRRV